MEKLFWASVDSFEKYGVSDEDVARFKGNYQVVLIGLMNSVEGKVFSLSANENHNGDPNGLAKTIQRYAALTKADVIQAFHKYIKGNYPLVLSVVPKGEEHMVAAPDNYQVDSATYKPTLFDYTGLSYKRPKDNFDRSQMPKDGPLPFVKAPNYWKEKLQNDVEIIATEYRELPILSFSLSLPGGHLAQAVKISKAGLSSILAEMMNEGTTERSPESWVGELNKLGGDISVSNSMDEIIIRGRALKQNAAKVIGLLQEKLFKPKFTEEALQLIKTRRLQELKASSTVATAIADRVFAKLSYGSENILGISERGTEASVNSITLEDVKELYGQLLTGAGAKLTVIGDLSQAEVLSMFSFLQQLSKEPKVRHQPKSVSLPSKKAIYIVDLPNSVQTVIRIGGPTGLTYDATGDFYKVGISNWMLGGLFTSRLEDVLREKKGWTYSARSAFKGDRYTGSFELATSVKAAATDSALQTALQMLDDYSKNGLTSEELSFTKTALQQREARRYETIIQKRDFLKNVLDYRLPADVLEQQQRILKNITQQELQQVTERYLQSQKMIILLVGDRKNIEPGIRALNAGEVIFIDNNGNAIL